MLLTIYLLVLVGWLVGCRVSGRMSHGGPKPMGGIPSEGIFLRDPSPYLPVGAGV